VGDHPGAACRGDIETGGFLVKAHPLTMLAAVIAVAAGVIVLLGYFLALPGLADLRALLLDWAVILAAVALLVGIVNLAGVHWHKVSEGGSRAFYSSVTLIALVLTLGLGLVAGPTSTGSMWAYNHVLIPIETGLMALLAVTLILAFTRIFSRKLTTPKLIFALAAVVALATAFAWPGLEIFGLTSLRAWLVNVWAVAGARGILLGVALGAIATGVRVLLGIDRPYSR
jgi:hypothetical protein